MKLNQLCDFDPDLYADTLLQLDDEFWSELHGEDGDNVPVVERDDEVCELCDKNHIRITTDGTIVRLGGFAKHRRNVTIRFIPSYDREQVMAAKLNDDLFIIVTDTGFIPWILPVGKYRCESLGFCKGWDELGKEIGYIFECMGHPYTSSEGASTP